MPGRGAVVGPKYQFSLYINIMLTIMILFAGEEMEEGPKFESPFAELGSSNEKFIFNSCSLSVFQL